MKQVIQGICPLEVISESYKRLGNVWKVAEEVGLCGQTVHDRLTKAGLIKKINRFTDLDKEILMAEYKKYRDSANLKELAAKMGRTVPFLTRKAKEMGLTDRKNRVSMKPLATEISNKRKEYYKEHEHPKGMQGKKHSEDFKAGASERGKRNWADPNSKFNSEEFRQNQSDNMSKWQASRENRSNNYSRTKKGWWENGEKKYYMLSKWEMNYAWYLEFLISKGEIKSWEYEVDTFWFEKIKRGVRSYTPDFKVVINSGSIEYHEVKGWMDDKSKTKIKRMAIYHPKVILKVVGEKEYKAIRKWANLIPNWIS
jgi:hypothetical protein